MNDFSSISIDKKDQKNATQTEWLAKHPTIRLFNVVDQQANIHIKSEEN